jgi:predicted phage terminase large subunit-like protein
MSAARDDKFATLVRWEKDRRRVKSGGFVPFCNAFGYQLAEHHELIAEKLQKTISTPNYNLIICMPPGHAKSRYASILFPSYYLGANPGKSVVMASHTAELSAKWGRACKRIIDDPKYNYMLNVSLNKDSKSSDRFDLSNGSEYFACGVGGGVTGQRADLGVIDDPVRSKEDSDSERIRDKTWDWYLNDFRTRLKPGASQVIIMTRWHEDDLVGRILASSDKDNWDVLILPAIAEANDQMYRKIGEPLWPDYIPIEMLEGIRKTTDVKTWSSLYQQNPTIETGDYFKKEDLKFVNRIPTGLNIYAASDYAVSAGRGDYTVHVIAGYDDKNDDIYVIDVWRQQTESNIWVEKFLDLAAKHKTLVWAEEQGQILKSLDPFIKKEMAARNQFVFREQFTSAVDKTVRARSFQAYMAQGKVYILNDTWTQALQRELLAFPSGKHDDQVDALGLIGRLLDEMRMKNKPSEKLVKDEFRSNMIMLPGLNESVGNKRNNSFRKI